jgi:hypothetical protein
MDLVIQGLDGGEGRALYVEKSAFSRASAKSRERAKAPPPPKAAHTCN